MASISKRASGAWQNTSYGIRGTATDTITTLPTTIYSDGTNATVSIKGNTTQSGTPTPDSPIMPQGTGERTGNLWDEDYANISLNAIYRPLFVGDGVFTLSTNFKISNGITDIFLLSGNVSSGISSSTNGAYEGKNITAQSIDGYITIAYRANARPSSGSLPYCKTMLNSGSTALPYEPYGFEIPISSAGQTNNIYLGEVETTRKIKKLVFDGLENWRQSTDGNIFIALSPNRSVAWTRVLSTHFTSSQIQTNGDLLWFVNANVDFDTVEECKTYLAQQYAAGAPVCVWYVLATPQTAVVNEPLMKIGDYADEVSGVSIPTTDGANTLSINTTVQPSEVSVNYHGWHMGTVHERTAGQWD